MKSANVNPSIITRLRENSVGPEGMHHFDLSNNALGPQEISAIGDAIKANGNNCDGMAPLITIDLSSNYICGINTFGRGSFEAEGLNDFCSALIALNKVSRLRKLNLSRNHLSLGGFGVISNLLSVGPSSITDLILRGCAGGPEAMERLAEGLKSNRSIQILDLRDNNIGEQGASYLAEFLSSSLRLKQLLLSGCHLEAAGCQRILLSLASNGGLETLALNDNACGDEGCEAVATFLRTNQKLRSLDLQENRIANRGIAQIAKGLTKNRTLVYLGLQWNEFDNNGAEKLAEALSTNNTLKGLHLVGTKVDEQGIRNLIDASLSANEKPVDIDLGVHLRPNSRARRRHPGRQSVELDPNAINVPTSPVGMSLDSPASSPDKNSVGPGSPVAFVDEAGAASPAGFSPVPTRSSTRPTSAVSFAPDVKDD